jgi:Peptidase_C39 like family
MMNANIAAATSAAVAIAAVILGSPGPAHATSDTMYGDPTVAAKYWHYQQYWDDCVLVSAADVVGQVTGHKLSEEDIIEVAQSTPSSQGPGPIYTRPADPTNPNSGEGTWFRDIPTLLAHYNIGAVVSNGDMEGLEQQLGAGHKVIASVNSDIIWREPVTDKDEHGNPTHNHTLVVTGVDTANNVVHLNDSGSRQGADEQVPLALFLQSWNTSNDLMAATT